MTGDTVTAGVVDHRVLRAGDDPGDRPPRLGALERETGASVDAETDFAAGLQAVLSGSYDSVVCTHDPAGFDGLAFLESVRQRRPSFPVVLVADAVDAELARRAVDADATALLSTDAEDLAAKIASRLEAAVPAADREDEGRMPVKNRTIEEELRLKERAMDAAPVGITISDPDTPDNEIIYANEAFEEVTGHPVEDVMGVNCRFLQGEETDPETVQTLTEAIDDGRPVSVELRNYRPDGSMFWNALTVHPIRDDEGDVAYYVGFQSDVTKRKRAEQQLASERATLDHLLDRVNGLVTDVTTALIQTGSRPELEREICRRFGADEEYVAAWIGDYDPPTDTVEVVEVAGDGSVDGDESAVDLHGETPGSRAIQTVVEDQTVETLTDPQAAFHPPVMTLDDDPATVAFVPLTYRRVTYGVLAIYAGEGVFDERELSLLSAIGQIVGSAVNASESKRLLTTETTIEVGVDVDGADAFVVDLSSTLDCQFEYEASVDHGDGDLAMLFGVTGADADEIRAAAADHDDVAAVEFLAERDGRSIVQFRLRTSPLFSLLSEYGANVTGLTAHNGEATLHFETASEESARSTIDALSARYEHVTLVEYHESERPAETGDGFRTALEADLTDRQLTALRNAYVSGFFEWPRQVEGDTLAESMDIVPSTFHQHLRAAERKLVAAFLED